MQSRVQTTAHYVTIGNITLSFSPYNPVQTVPPNAITYLVGFVQISKLNNIIARPLTLIVDFTPNLTYPEYGNVTYEFTQTQTLEIPPELDAVMMPFGVFPLQITGFKAGDEILFDIEITATVQWVGTEVTRGSITARFTLMVT